MFLSVSTVFSRVSDGSSPVCFHILDWSALGVFVFFLDEEGSEHDLLTHKHTHTHKLVMLMFVFLCIIIMQCDV